MKLIRIRNACTHNLKNVDVDIPRDCLVVITGPSGCGKSSLAFDTIFAEGQRRYVESVSIHARQFLSRLPRPDVESIDGLPPTIAIDQQTGGHSPRSTVGTATEIYDFIRLLFSRAGEPHCVKCGAAISPMTVDQMVDRVLAGFPEGTRFSVLSPVARSLKGNLEPLLKRLKKSGYVRIAIDGQPMELSSTIKVDARKSHDVEVTIDRLAAGGNIRNRLADSIELALKESSGLVTIAPIDGEPMSFTSSHSCIACGEVLPVMEPSSFSFNTPAGACPSCGGLGEVLFFDESKVIPDPSLSLRDGAIAPWSRRGAHYFSQLLDAVTTHVGIDPFAPWHKLPAAHRQLLLHGCPDEIEFTVENDAGTQVFKRIFEGVLPNLDRRNKEAERRNKENAKDFTDATSFEFTRYMSAVRCEACKGARLRPEALSVTVGGYNIAQIAALTVQRCTELFSSLSLPSRQTQIAAPLLKEIEMRLQFLCRVGLGYLNINRTTATLSGGEAQRIRLATQIGSALAGVCYILDEPSIGLHQRDNDRLLTTLRALVDRGNSVILVEHDADTIAAAEHIVDMGPGAGPLGGKIIAQGTPEEIRSHAQSLTGAYLSGRKAVPIPGRRRKPGNRALQLRGVRTNNLQQVDVDIPLGLLIAVTGVSGSGKSSLVMDTLLPALRHKLNGTTASPTWSCDEIKGFRNIDKVIDVDQSPIGRTPRSNPATFTGVFNDIRELFADLPDSRVRGYKAGRYSFNVKGGRCEACNGDGLLRIEMNFMPDAFVTCEVCGGKRYNRETLEIRYRGRNIDDLLAMTCAEAATFLENHPKIFTKLETLRRVGLGYLTLGQNAATLSGGEAQRLKLAKELSRKSTGNTLYILDEPTTGLHFDDVHVLLEVLNELVDQGNTMLVIEHNLDVIKSADHVIDLGPDGGDGGGRIVAVGTPEDIARSGTATGEVLKRVLTNLLRSGG